MKEVVELIANYGVSAIIVFLFIWDWYINKKDMKQTLEVIKDTSVSISKSLDLLQKSMDRHDEKLDKLLEARRK